jgi:dCMP deaminase
MIKSSLRGNIMKRIDKNNYYLDLAEAALERSTCLRRKYGAVIVKNDEIISTGYNGAPRGRENCTDIGTCIREELKIPRGERYELCRSVHAEQNAIISAARKDMIGSTLYEVGIDVKTGKYVENSMPCAMCKRFIINSGIKKMIFRDTKTKYREVEVQDLIDNDDSLNGTKGY